MTLYIFVTSWIVTCKQRNINLLIFTEQTKFKYKPDCYVICLAVIYRLNTL